MSITKNFLKASGIGIFIAFILFLSGAPSWGDTRLMIDQAPDGTVRETIWDGTTLNTTASASLPGNGTNPEVISCAAPVVNWDSSVNGWIIFGVNNDTTNSMWSEKIVCTTYSTSSTSSTSGCTLSYTTAPAGTACPNGLTLAPACLVSTAQTPTLLAVMNSSFNGSCGSSSGGSFSTMPTNLCNLGTASVVGGGSSTGSWTWTCSGSGGGTNASCSATYIAAPVSGSCGSDDGGTFSSTPPSSGLCTTGTASGVGGGSSTGSWTWTCSGSNGGTTANCSATYATTPVNGACGTSNGQTLSSAPTTNLCTYTGTTPTVTGTGPWTWSCTGSNGGTTATCTAYNSTSGGSAIPLTYAGGSMSFKDTLQPGAEKIYVFTVPSGTTGFSANFSSIDQGTNVNLLLEQGSMANIDSYYSDAVTWYTTYATWGSGYYKSYPPAVWARMSNSVNENIYLKQSTSNTSTTCVVAPGTYYLLVKNTSTCTTCVASYYVYAQPY